ncbi:MAG: hypothetical protein NTU58_01605 [Candidatus Nealsonbacteria bacterium]|nr:hypothetical protein [Candidatus Nealsonbacteria bacterium]
MPVEGTEKEISSVLLKPIKGNDRLEELRFLVLNKKATPCEEKEFWATLSLYKHESIGRKPRRTDPELYEETEELKRKNEEQRKKS